MKFIISWTESVGPIHHLLRKRHPDPRMSDVELAIRYLAFRDQQTQYTGDLKKFLDEFCKNKNIEFINNPESIGNYQNLLMEMNEGIVVGLSEFGEQYFCRKYSNGKYEARFNRAVFDVLVGALSYNDIREWVLKNPGKMKALYERVCDDNLDFVKSVETTTKSPEAIRIRFGAWYKLISENSGTRLSIPNVK